MWQCILDHTRRNNRNRLKVLRSVVYYEREVTSSRYQNLKFDVNKLFSIYRNEIINTENINFRRTQIKIFAGVDERAFKLNKTIFFIEIIKPMTEDIFNRPKHVKIKYNKRGKLHNIIYNDFDLMIAFSSKGYNDMYEDVLTEYRNLEDSICKNEHCDDPFAMFKIQDIKWSLQSIRLGNKGDTLGKGFFPSPYIDEKGKRNFMCIARSTPFTDENKNPICKERLKGELDKILKNPFNYDYESLMKFQ